jgi:hypothetical protein
MKPKLVYVTIQMPIELRDRCFYIIQNIKKITIREFIQDKFEELVEEYK